MEAKKDDAEIGGVKFSLLIAPRSCGGFWPFDDDFVERDGTTLRVAFMGRGLVGPLGSGMAGAINARIMRPPHR